jgi:hypothetical protein
MLAQAGDSTASAERYVGTEFLKVAAALGAQRVRLFPRRELM